MSSQERLKLVCVCVCVPVFVCLCLFLCVCVCVCVFVFGGGDAHVLCKLCLIAFVLLVIRHELCVRSPNESLPSWKLTAHELYLVVTHPPLFKMRPSSPLKPRGEVLRRAKAGLFNYKH